MITVTALQHVIPGKETELVSVMKSLTEQVKKNEPGCTIFEFVHSQEQANVYLVIEQYLDQETLDKHLKTPYLQDAIPKIFACLEGGAPEQAVYVDV